MTRNDGSLSGPTSFDSWTSRTDMNLFQLVLKQMRQRALGTWLTLLSVLLGVGLAIAVLIVRAGSQSLLSQTDYGYDLIIGKGSPTQLVLNTVYHIENSPGNIPYSMYENLPNPRHPYAKTAVPLVVGDTYKGRRIVGTLPKMFGYTDEGSRVEEDARAFQYRPGKRFELADGRVFHPKKFEAVIGSELTKQIGLKIGDEFEAVHGAPAEGQKEHVHKEKWKVVGVLRQTHTSNDRVIFIPLVTSFAIDEHREGLEAQSKIRAAIEGAARRRRPLPCRPRLPPRLPRPRRRRSPQGTSITTTPTSRQSRREGRARATTTSMTSPRRRRRQADAHDHDDHAHAEAKPAVRPTTHDHDHEQPATTTATTSRRQRRRKTSTALMTTSTPTSIPRRGKPRLRRLRSTKVKATTTTREHGHQHEGVAHEHEAYFINADGTIEPKAPKTQWLLSAILVKTREVPINGRMLSNPLPLKYVIDASGTRDGRHAGAGDERVLQPDLRRAEHDHPDGVRLVTVVAAVGILVSIYNSVSARSARSRSCGRSARRAARCSR